MIQRVDESVGRITARLAELGLERDTVFIFSSDNGGLGGYDRTEPPSDKRGFTDNSPLRGGKGTLYEGGLRVPFIVRWPGVVPAGTLSDQPAAHIDVYPTLLELAGGRPRPGQLLDGVSLVPLLRNPGSQLGRAAIHWHFPGYLESYVHPRGWRTGPVGAIHAGNHKLLEFFETGAVELYDLARDPGETRDLAAAEPARAAELRAQLAAWRQATGAAMPRMKTPAELAASDPTPPARGRRAASPPDQE
jgi:arylsulfatase A-like enzyme